ncbi:double Clp-N motif-containing P-loop nucleoside triphosphate hydrolases superfamily protein [Wolffia australiana]
MRAGLSTILQTLTAEAASVLKQSIAEACKRNHGQTTPLHVAATLISSPSGILRQACVRSHPNTSHPLQCRALELCFSVALDRLPSAVDQSSVDSQPSISNALMAALKRAQANQRRGCPEQQQQPLLAIKVELRQLIVSILDDPSVSRVMREASFSSPAVKAAVEQFISAAPPADSGHSNSVGAAKSLPLLAGIGLRATAAPPAIPFRPVNRNLYANPRLQQQESEETRQAFDILRRRRKRNLIMVGDGGPEAAAGELLKKMEEKGIGHGLPLQFAVFSVENAVAAAADALQAAATVQDLGNSVDRRLRDGGAAAVLDVGNLQWLVERAGRGVAAAAVSETKSLLSRLSESGRVWLVGSSSPATYLRCQVYHPSLELDWDLQALPVAARRPASSLRTPPPEKPGGGGGGTEMCSLCKDSYEQELGKLVAMEFEKSSGAKPIKPLAPWLQLAKLSTDNSVTQSQTREQELSWKKTTEELLRRWSETCTRLHSKSRPSDVHPTAPARPASPVATDLVLAHQKSSPEKPNCAEMDAFKRIFKALVEKVSWQQEAASAAAAAVARPRPGGRGDSWLLFEGPDLLGKKKMAAVLAAALFNSEPITVSFGTAAKHPSPAGFSRGKTGIDRMAEALRRNPFSVFMLEGVDSADSVVLVTLRRAAEKGRLADSHGREVPVGGAVFVLNSGTGAGTEEKLFDAAHSGWQLVLAPPEKAGKRRAEPDWSANSKQPRLCLDLNLAAAGDDEDASDVTVETGGEWAALRSAVDSAVEFRPVDFGGLRRMVAETMARKFKVAAGEGRTLVVDPEAMDLLVGGLWFGSTPPAAFDEWADNVVVPTFGQSTGPVLKLLPLKEGGAAADAVALPTRVRVLP